MSEFDKELENREKSRKRRRRPLVYSFIIHETFVLAVYTGATSSFERVWYHTNLSSRGVLGQGHKRFMAMLLCNIKVLKLHYPASNSCSVPESVYCSLHIQ